MVLKTILRETVTGVRIPEPPLNERKCMNHVTSIVALLFLGAMCVLWPGWLRDGYIDTWYLKIATFIAVYGGFTANLVWWIQHVRRNR